MFFCIRFDFIVLFFATFSVIGTNCAGTVPQSVSFTQPDGPSSIPLCHSSKVTSGADDAHQACKDECLIISDAVNNINKCYGEVSKYIRSLHRRCADFEDGKCEKGFVGWTHGYQCICVRKKKSEKRSALRCRADIPAFQAFANLDLFLKNPKTCNKCKSKRRKQIEEEARKRATTERQWREREEKMRHRRDGGKPSPNRRYGGKYSPHRLNGGKYSPRRWDDAKHSPSRLFSLSRRYRQGHGHYNFDQLAKHKPRHRRSDGELGEALEEEFGGFEQPQLPELPEWRSSPGSESGKGRLIAATVVAAEVGVDAAIQTGGDDCCTACCNAFCGAL